MKRLDDWIWVVLLVSGMALSMPASAQPYASCTEVEGNPEQFRCSLAMRFDLDTPTTRENGVALSFDEIKHYQIVGVQESARSTIPDANTETCGQCWTMSKAAAAGQQNTLRFSPTIQISKADIIDDGQATTYWFGRTIDTDDRRSGYAEAQSVWNFDPAFVSMLRPSPPGKPINFTASVDG